MAKVFFGQLTKPLVTYTVTGETSLADFCEKRGIKYSASVRVNGKTQEKGYILREDDVVTAIDKVDGGK